MEGGLEPDSQTLYYSVGDITLAPNGNTNDIRLYQQPANNSSAGTELLHVSGAHVFQPSISPDGTKLCYTLSTAAGNSTTATVVAAPLSSPSSLTVITESGVGDYNCTWSPDGTKIAYTEDFAGNGEVVMRQLRRVGKSHRPDQYARRIRRQPRLGTRRPADLPELDGHDYGQHAGHDHRHLQRHRPRLRAVGCQGVQIV